MNAHVLLILLNELGKRDKMRGLSSIYLFFHNEINKFNNTRARMLDSIYHMTLRCTQRCYERNNNPCYGRHNVSSKSINH